MSTSQSHHSIITSLQFAGAMQQLHGTQHVPIAIAVSGGVDSMCLAYLTQEWASHHHISLTALIVDHGLRPESSAEAEKVKQELQRQGIEARILPWHGPKPTSNIHQTARNHRYRLLTEYCKQHHITTLLTGHNQDDQAETVLMRILRGTGITGLTGIKAVGQHNGITVLRPLLYFTRAQIQATMEEAALQWVEDPSNQDPKYTRSTVRKWLSLLPHSATTKQRLVLLAQNAERAEDYLQQQTIEFITHHSLTVQIKSGTALTLNRPALIVAHPEIALRALRQLLMQQASMSVSSSVQVPRLERLERLYQHLIDTSHPPSPCTLCHCRVAVKGEWIYISKE